MTLRVGRVHIRFFKFFKLYNICNSLLNMQPVLYDAMTINVFSHLFWAFQVFDEEFGLFATAFIQSLIFCGSPPPIFM